MKKNSPTLLLVLVLISAVLLGYLYFEINRETKLQSDRESISISKTEKPITFMIAGDAMFGRAVAWKFNNDVTQTFENLGQDFFAKTDMSILNLEGPINDKEFSANPNPDNLIFNFPPQTTNALKFLSVKTVGLANNHSSNQGLTGFNTTKGLLSQNNITAIGSQTHFNDDSIKKFSKMTIIAVNLVGRDFDITSAIKSEKQKGQFVLVFPHWGNEYQTTHSLAQEKSAHLWIEAGADLVIGSHPHVVQDAEVYLGKPIFYSLGNLIFDQTFSTKTQRGLIISGEISSQQTKVTLMPTIIRNYQVELATTDEKQAFIDKFKKNLPNENWQENTLILQR